MGFLEDERAELAALLPGLDERLAAVPLLDLERPHTTAIERFREAGGPGLLVPAPYGGLGATPLQAIRVQRAVASRSPSLAVATTMHHFSVATLVEYAVFGPGADLLGAVAGNRWLLASGFAEGRSGVSILAPYMEAQRDARGFRVSGSKKPCSLSRSMDLLTASVLVADGVRGEPRRALVLVPADAMGIERRPFWASSVLTGAESDEVVLHEVQVPERYVFFPDADAALDPVEAAGFLWFQLLISASYLGVASALVERAVAASKGAPGERALLGIDLEGAMAALEGVARSMMAGDGGPGLLARGLLVRYAVQQAIERVSVRAAELLGGIAFVTSPEPAYLLAAARALAFHPPSRTSASPGLASYLAGEPLLLT
jgi:alkylation response protein AidB-like acyl-CoA dehydrogenase